MEVEDRIFTGESISGIATYFKDKHGWYYWSGKIAILYRALSAPGVLTDEKYQEAGELVANWEFATNASEKKEAVSRSAHDMDEQIEYEDIVFEEKTEESIPVSGAVLTSDEALAPSSSTQLVEETAPNVPEKHTFQAEKILTSIQHLELPGIFWEAQQLLGEQINIAILDTGINPQHPDLKDAIKAYRNFSSSQDNRDEDGEGTINALLIASRGHQGYYGIAPKSNLIVAKIATSTQQANYDSLMNALQWVVAEQTKLAFINVDLLDRQLGQQEKNTLQQFLLTHQKKGVCFIAPVGDSLHITPENRYPASFEQCLSIGTHDSAGRKVRQSARSYHLDILAPMVEELAPKVKCITGHSAAFATGVVALLLEFCQKNNLDLTANELISLLQDTAQRNDANHNIERGYGLLNPQNALAMLLQKRERS